MSVRTEQVASTLRRAVQAVIARGLHDPRVRGMITITNVQVAPDLSEAYIDVSVLPEKHETLTLHGLQHASRMIRGEVAKAVSLRKLPRLLFRVDESIKQQARIAASLRDVRAEGDGEDDPADEGQDAPGEAHS